MSDPYDLERFVTAQDPVWARVTAELSAGRKQSHWMWFVFPQIAGLGMSATSQLYALPSKDAAKAYLTHPILGARIRETTYLMLGHKGKSAEAILGGIDALKFRSSMTLFDAADDGGGLFTEALDAFYAGEPDPETLKRL